MANDLNLELRKELVGALAPLQLQVKGLQYYNRFVPEGSEFLVKIKQGLIALIRRRDLIQSVLDDLDDLNDAKDQLDQDGYPTINKIQLFRNLFDELKLDAKELDAAEALFELEHMPTRVELIPGVPSDKT